MAVIPSLWVAIPTMWKEALTHSLQEFFRSAKAQFPILNTVNEVTPVGLLLIVVIGVAALATMLTNRIYRLLVGKAKKSIQSEPERVPVPQPEPELEFQYKFEHTPEPDLIKLNTQSEREDTSDLEITDDKVFSIINANPDFFPYQKDEKGTKLTTESIIKKVMDKDRLVARLLAIRNEMQACFGDGTTQYDQLKYILLSALNAKDLAPLNLKTKIDKIDSELRIELAAHYASYISYVSPDAFIEASIKNSEPGQNGNVLPVEALYLRQDIAIYPNVVNSVCGLDEVRTQYPIPDVVDTSKPLTPESKFELLQGLATVIQRETRIKEEANGLATDYPAGCERLGL
jgi:hypothetical protein